ncbi:MAG: hypothetical protein ACOYZ7_11125 [Chloroflexota bacterium]
MKIENLKSEKIGNRARVAATISWEDNDRPTQEVYFETDEAFAQDLSCNPHAFLVGCIMPALQHGEKRILVEGAICPELQDGLITAMAWIRHWYDSPERRLVKIEAKTNATPSLPRIPKRAGSFLSGGIDSLATLRTNRLNYPLEHPGSIKDCLLIYGQNIESDDRPETFELAMHSLSEITQDAGITLIPVYTNTRSLDYDTNFFLYKFQAAILSAVAHAFARRFTTVTIASGDNIPGLHAWGTHPILDPNFSSFDLRIRHDSNILSRFEKTKLVAEWNAALQHIKVCPSNWPGTNCGHCEKCLRTMLALLALGVLEQTRAFPQIEITPEMINSTVRIKSTTVFHYEELLPRLAEMGRNDLVRAIENRIARYQAGHSYHESAWKKKIKQFDQKYLQGRLARTKKSVFPLRGGKNAN